MLYHATLHRNPHIIFTNYLGSFALFSVFNRTFLRVIDHFSGQEDQTFCRQWVPKKLHCWESSENQNHFLTQQTDACFHQTRVMVVPTVYTIQGFHQVWCQGGVKVTVSGVVEDLKFEISEGSDPNWCFPDSAQLAVSVQLRQLTGQSQENTNFGCSLLKFYT